MAHAALVISKEEIDLDSRFGWAAGLANSDFSGENVIILHNSNDSDEALVSELTKLWASNNKRKFIYINSELSPFIQAFFFGIDGLVLDDDDALADPDILLSVIDDYRQCTLKVQAPAEKFAEVRQALSSILEGNLDASDINEIVTNPDWLKQLRGSMDLVSSSLTVVDKSNHALVKFVDYTRQLLMGYKGKIAETKLALQEAENKIEEARMEGGSSNSNRIRTYPPIPLPVHVQKVLYISEFSPCMFLTSFILAYQQYLRGKKGVTSRLLIVQHDSDCGHLRYNPNTFYSINQDSIHKTAPDKVSGFILSEPKQNLMQYFFDTSNCKLFIIIDRFLQNTPVIRSSPKMKMLYASNSVSLFEEKQIAKRSTIAPMRKDIQDGGINIPYLNMYTKQNAVAAYFGGCKDIYARLDSLLDLE